MLGRALCTLLLRCTGKRESVVKVPGTGTGGAASLLCCCSMGRSDGVGVPQIMCPRGVCHPPQTPQRGTCGTGGTLTGNVPSPVSGEREKLMAPKDRVSFSFFLAPLELLDRIQSTHRFYYSEFRN